MGRRIFDNLKKAIAYIFSVHIPIAGLSALPVMFGWPLILLPLHIVFLEFIIDPACTTVFEAESEEKDIMQSKPRSITFETIQHESGNHSRNSGYSCIRSRNCGLSVFNYGRFKHDTARTMAFTTIVLTNLALIVTNRSWSQSIVGIFRKPNKAFWQIVVLCNSRAITSNLFATTGSLFAFAALSPMDLLICFIAGFGSIVWFEIYKVVKKGKLGA